MSAAGEAVSLTGCINGIIAAYHEAEAIVERIKIRCAHDRVAPPSRVLEDSIDQAPRDIERERKDGVARLGKKFEQGDSKSIIELQQVNLLLETGLISGLKSAAFDEDATTDVADLIDAADTGRDRTVQILVNLGHRLQPVAPTPRSAPREIERPLSMRPSLKSSQTEYPTPTSPTAKHHKVWARDDSGVAGGEEEDATAGADLHETNRSHSHSLLSVFRHRRSGSGFGDGRSDSNDSRQLSVSYLPMHLPRSHSFRDLTSSTRSISGPKATSNDRESHSHRPSHLSEESQDRRDTVSVPPGLPNSLTPSMLSTSPTLTRTMSSSSPRSARRNTIPRPNPENDYLGFCKAAVQLQNGDKKGMQRSREFNDGWSSSTVHYLTCSNSKCAFYSRIDMDVIWTKVWKPDESSSQPLGLQFRWSFLAKSHMLQLGKIKNNEFRYQCLFCVYQGEKQPPDFHGTDPYLNHVSLEHRGKDLSDLVLYKTCCTNDSVCDDDQDFDINLFPVLPDEKPHSIRHATSQKSSLDMQDSMFADVDNEPWDKGLSDFHYDEEFERIERCE